MPILVLKPEFRESNLWRGLGWVVKYTFVVKYTLVPHFLPFSYTFIRITGVSPMPHDFKPQSAKDEHYSRDFKSFRK